MPFPALLDHELETRRIFVQAKDVVYVKGILEGYGGVAAVFAQHGGDLTLAAPASRIAELDQLLADLSCEIPSLRVL